MASLGLDPLLHYEEIGKAEGLATEAAAPHPTAPQDPLVDAATVYAQRPDLVAASDFDARIAAPSVRNSSPSPSSSAGLRNSTQR